MKRLFDVLMVVLLSPLVFVLSFVVACLVYLFLGRPVFFIQKRSGRGGKAFNLVKFRTMKASGGSDAQRLTRFGRFLRA